MKIRRDFYLNKLIETKHDSLIKVITGIRRCGKSYLLNTLFYEHLMEIGVDTKHIIQLAFDEPDNAEFRNPLKFGKYVKSCVVDEGKYYCLFDEIQLVEDFEGVLNGLLRIPNLDIYVTGSNSKFLSSDIITEFRGRGEEIRVYPLSFAEFYSAKGGERQEAWEEYCTFGGLPLLMSMDSERRKVLYLQDQQKNAYINDVVERNNLHNEVDLVRLVETLASGIGSLSNPQKLSNTFKSEAGITIDAKTIRSYLGYLEEAFIVEKTNRYDIKGNRYLFAPYKYYFTDIGIRNAFINFRQNIDSHTLENIIYLELRRRDYMVDVGVVKQRSAETSRQFEIDFVANRGHERVYIQSALTIPTVEKREQEERSLSAVDDSFRKVIITGNPAYRSHNEEGILTMNVFDFLLDEKSLEY